MNKVLIIGGDGFLGKQIRKKLEFNSIYTENFHHIEESNLDSSLHIENRLKTLIQYDYIFHCANYFTPGISTSKFLDAQKNTKLNKQLIEFWQKYQFNAKFVSFGSDACYSDISNKIEENYLVGEPIEDYRDYAWSKRNLYNNLKELNVTKGMNFYHFVLITLYGPFFKEHDEHLVHSIIKKISQGKNIQEYIPEFWGDGKQIREITFVEDVIDNILNIIALNDKKFMNRPINLGSNIALSIETLVEEICKLMNYDHKKVIFNKEKHSGVQKKTLNSDFAIQNLDNYKITTFREALKKTIEYYELKHKLLQL